MTVQLLVATRTDVGRVRPGNEDAFLVTDDVRLVAVADGMGGHQAGEVASATAITALLARVEEGDSIADAISRANDAVVTKAAEDVSLRGMGTTLTAGVVDGSSLLIGHVGDSRAYLLRDGALRQLTTDHSVIAELVAAGELTEAEALVDPRRAMITRALGIDASVVVDVLEVELVPGDRLLLCSDGLTTMVRDDGIAEILATETDRERAADALVEAANLAGGADNITVVVADVAEAPVQDRSEDGLTAVAAPDETPGTEDGERLEDTEQVPVVDGGTDGSSTAVLDPAAPVDVDPDAELEELRAVIDDGAPRRRWWQRRPRS
jgi:protein phosphatase